MGFETRRDFFKATAVGAAGIGLSYWIGGQARGDGPAKAKNDQPTIGYIGTGIRYHEDLGHTAVKFGPCAAICDVDSVQAGRALQVAFDEHRSLNRPLQVDLYEDYRHLLDRDDIDAVVIATPDHWHTKIAIEAMRAGKDVYCEKPLTLTIREGQQLLQAIDETKRVVQVGTQQRTEFDHMFANAVAMIADGRIGKLERITCAIGPARACEPLSTAAPPKSLNWEVWQGQTPAVDYRQGPLGDATGYGAGHPLGRTHHYFRWWYEYSGGKMTDWGAHHVDCACWALGLDKTGPNSVRVEFCEHPVPFEKGYPTLDDRYNTATGFRVVNVFDDAGVELTIRHDTDNGILFEGDKGRIFVSRGKLAGKPVEELAGNPLPEDAMRKAYKGSEPVSHMQNFFDCVKNRKEPMSDVFSHHRSLTNCHLANIALRLNRDLKWDPVKEAMIDDAEAQSFVAREQRKGYEITA
jgi:predicted dehydrogenase